MITTIRAPGLQQRQRRALGIVLAGHQLRVAGARRGRAARRARTRSRPPPPRRASATAPRGAAGRTRPAARATARPSRARIVTSVSSGPPEPMNSAAEARTAVIEADRPADRRDPLAVDAVARLPSASTATSDDRRLRARHQLDSDSAPTPSRRKPSRSQRPHASSPAPPASATCAPWRAAVTATFATAPPRCGTNASAVGTAPRPGARTSDRRSRRRGTASAPREGWARRWSGLASLTRADVILAAGCASTSTRSTSTSRPSSTGTPQTTPGAAGAVPARDSDELGRLGRVPRPDRWDRARPDRVRTLRQGRPPRLLARRAHAGSSSGSSPRCKSTRSSWSPTTGAPPSASTLAHRHPERVERLVAAQRAAAVRRVRVAAIADSGGAFRSSARA